MSWSTQGRKWVAEIRHRGRVQRIGDFVDEDEAARAYDAQARALHGPGAWLNFPEAGERQGTAQQRRSAAELAADGARESGYRGVSWAKRSLKWEARIRHGGRQHYLGYFTDEDEAGRAYQRARLEIQQTGTLSTLAAADSEDSGEEDESVEVVEVRGPARRVLTRPELGDWIDTLRDDSEEADGGLSNCSTLARDLVDAIARGEAPASPSSTEHDPALFVFNTDMQPVKAEAGTELVREIMALQVESAMDVAFENTVAQVDVTLGEPTVRFVDAPTEIQTSDGHADVLRRARRADRAHLRGVPARRRQLRNRVHPLGRGPAGRGLDDRRPHDCLLPV
eukprot:COSAG04_NODE_209_length_20232_cov_116.817315_29_plen_338_part_00